MYFIIIVRLSELLVTVRMLCWRALQAVARVWLCCAPPWHGRRM